MEYKENFLDRVEQTFSLLVRNHKIMIWPTIAYMALNIINLIFLKISFRFAHLGTDWYTDLINLELVGGYLVFIILYVLAFLVIELGFIKNVKDIIDGHQSTPREYLSYGSSNLLNSFKTYYYVFMYVLLIPSVILLAGLLLLLNESLSGKISLGNQPSVLAFVGMGLVFASVITLIVMSIYRGTRSRFAILKAVDHNDFSRTSFGSSLGLSEGKWLRIFGNMFFIGMLVGLVASLLGQLGGTIDLIFTGYPQDYAAKIRSGDFNQSNIDDFIASLTQIRFSGILSAAVGGISFVFVNSFLFILYRRLEQEKSIGSDQHIDKMIAESDL